MAINTTITVNSLLFINKTTWHSDEGGRSFTQLKLHEVVNQSPSYLFKTTNHLP